jgi:hypothetical protein
MHDPNCTTSLPCLAWRQSGCCLLAAQHCASAFTTRLILVGTHACRPLQLMPPA